MQANTDRTAALAFGDLVQHYDAGRIGVGREFVTKTLARLGIRPASARAAGASAGSPGPGSPGGASPGSASPGGGSPGGTAVQLEVGAGTGQLTGALLADGGRVIAVEPSGPMASRLARHFAAEVAAGRLRLRVQPFESLSPAGLEPVSQIWSSDAWHWVEPQAGYSLAADLLPQAGYLICTWSFPVVADAGLAEELNRVYARLSPDLVRHAESQSADLEPQFAAGRAEVEVSGRMSVADYWTETAEAELPAAGYADLQLSFAQIAALSGRQRADLAAAIGAVLAARGQSRVLMTILRYTVASRPS